MGRLQNHLKRKFLAGALAAIPIVITAVIVWYVDAQVRELFSIQIPLVGIVVAVLLVYAVGVFVTSLLGRYFLEMTDRALNAVPGMRDLYRTWKQVAVTADVKDGIFAQVVLIPDESGRLRMLGFTSGRPIEGSLDTLCVFVPASPNPTSGRLYFVPRPICLPLPVGAKEALKFIVSGGNYVPPAIGAALSGT